MILKKLFNKVYLLWAFVLISAFAHQILEKCPSKIVNHGSANGNVATTTINRSGYGLGSSIFSLTNTSIVLFINNTEEGHQSYLGIEIGNSGNADSFAERIEAAPFFLLPIYNLNDLAKVENSYTYDMTKLTVHTLEKFEKLYVHIIEQQDKIGVQQLELDHLKMQTSYTNEGVEKLLTINLSKLNKADLNFLKYVL